MEQWQSALLKAANSERCEAKTRANGKCQSPAMQNGRCRMHGGKSTGAPCGAKHGLYKHGRYTKESLIFYAELRRLMHKSKKAMEQII